MASEVFQFKFPGAAPPATENSDEQPRVLWFAPHSLNTRQVARAWEQRGELADLRDISGPWAAVLWQPRSRKYYVLTDPLGVQPLFWTLGADARCYVSSWLDELLVQSQLPLKLDYEAVLLDAGDRLMVDRLAHRTRFVGVSRVLWGRAVEFDAQDGVRTLSYWDRDELPEPDESLSVEDSAELLADAIDQALGRVLAEGKDFGAHVSGGLDCTTVAVRANQILNRSGEKVRFGYSWAPAEAVHPRVVGDERSLLDLVSAQEGFPIRRLVDDGRGDWFWSRDINRYPQSTHLLERLVLPTARDDGVQVLLSGWGGDEIASFNGRNVVATLIRRRRFATAWRQARQRAGSVQQRGVRSTLAAAHMLARATSPRLAGATLHPRQMIEQRRVLAEIDRELEAAWPTVAQSRREAAEYFAKINDYRDYQWFLMTNGHLQHRITWWYQTGRLFDIHYRFPLVDLDVVKAAFRVPWHAYLHDGWTRAAFRKAAARWVPAEVAWNPTKSEPAQLTGIRKVLNRPSTPHQALRNDPKLAEVLYLSDRTYRSPFA